MCQNLPMAVLKVSSMIARLMYPRFAELFFVRARYITICLGTKKQYLKIVQTSIALVRIEELYPFPEVALRALCEKYSDAELMYVQEEPENMGAWQYIDSTFRDRFEISLSQVCRRPCASPAVASNKMHTIEQQRILIEAIGLPANQS